LHLTPFLVIGGGVDLAPATGLTPRRIIKEEFRALTLGPLGQANAIHESTARATGLLPVNGKEVENRLRLG
jgi:hypothetical protein